MPQSFELTMKSGLQQTRNWAQHGAQHFDLYRWCCYCALRNNVTARYSIVTF